MLPADTPAKTSPVSVVEPVPAVELIPALGLVSEFNSRGCLIHFPAYPGAYVRGPDDAVASSKASDEARSFAGWAGMAVPPGTPRVTARVKAEDHVRIDDGDSEVLLDADRGPLGESEFGRRCDLVVRSAECIARLYGSIPDPDWPDPAKARTTFYGPTPATARQMLSHMDGIAEYYLSRIGICDDLGGGVVERRWRAVAIVRARVDSISDLYDADGESWTLAKVLRRFVMHDRMHAKALWRLGLKMGLRETDLDDAFGFGTANR